MNIYLDIETIPTGDKPTADILKPPGQMKLADTIKKWYADTEARAEDLDDVYRKRALSMTESRILCIAFAIEDNPVVGVTGETEKDVLVAFMNALLEHDSHIFDRTFRLIAHNGRQFDFPILYLRAVKYKIGQLPRLFHVANPYESYVDTMVKFGFTARGTMTSLKSACAFFGIQAKKDDIDGSQVYDYYLDGKTKEVVEYCKSDVEAVRNLYKALTFGEFETE
jgi:predicted PolB exonuclease-like 3'-5' exonuclease